MNDDMERLADQLCQVQEAGQHLGEVAPTTAAHWRDVASRVIALSALSNHWLDEEYELRIRMEGWSGSGLPWRSRNPDTITVARLLAILDECRLAYTPEPLVVDRSAACPLDPLCYRYQGHDGEHMHAFHRVPS